MSRAIDRALKVAEQRDLMHTTSDGYDVGAGVDEEDIREILTAALDGVLEDDEAMSRARYAYLNSPPYAANHDDAGRLAHMRATIRAAFEAALASPRTEAPKEGDR